MYALTVSDHVMIAHSFRGEVFGPAQRLHGATFVIDAAFQSRALDANGLVVDIGCASRILREVLAPLDYRHLDDLPLFAGCNTTTEFLAAWIHGQVAARCAGGELGRPAGEVVALRVTVSESHVARAWFEAPLG